MSNVANCPFCHEPIRAGVTVIRCPVCGIGHHKECWYSNDQRCAVFGCAGRGEGVVLGAAAAIETSDRVERDDEPTAMELAFRRALGNEVIMVNATAKGTTITIDCPHCGGKTVCNRDDKGSCVRCLLKNGITLIGKVVLCSVCHGTGEIEAPAVRINCRHCGGTTWCRHGVNAKTSCENCFNFSKQGHSISSIGTYGIYEVSSAITMCSLCQGRGYRE